MNILLHIIITILLLPWGGIVMMSPMMLGSKGFRDNKVSMLSGMLFLGYPVLVFIILSLIQFNYFKIEANTWLLWSSVIVTVIIFLSGIPKYLYNLERGIINTGYHCANEFVYLNGEKIVGATAKSFKVLDDDTRYAIDKQHVFYNGEIIIGADPTTFQCVEIETIQRKKISSLYWKDLDHIYFEGKICENCDVKTFTIISENYGKDVSRVYYKGLTLKDANPKTFIIIKDVIARDNSSLFILNKRVTEPIDLETFKVIECNENFCVDKYHVYVIFYHLNDPLIKMLDADPVTFLPLERNYARDQNNVYFYECNKRSQVKVLKLKDVNTDSFCVGYEQVTNSDATDGDKCFMNGKLV